MQNPGDFIFQRDNRVLPATRWLAVFIIPFLVAASVILLIRPAESGRLFAWPIKPAMSAMLLGSAYMGGIYFFVRVARACCWSDVQIGFLSVTTFASILGIATILHWDRFTHNHISFFAWAGLYFTAPFLVLGTWWVNRRADPGIRSAADGMPPWAVGVLGISGAGVIFLGLLLFGFPGLLIPVWPWTLTPLTARVVSALFLLAGVSDLLIALDRRWSAARVTLESQAFALVVILISAARSWGDFAPTPASFLFLAGMGGLLVFIAALYALMERGRRR